MFFVLVFLSLVIYTTGLTGSAGLKIHRFFHLYFGALAFLIPPALFALYYKIYKEQSLSHRLAEVFSAGVLAFICLLMFQEFIPPARSKLGSMTFEVLTPVLGVGGYVILALLIALLAAQLYFREIPQKIKLFLLAVMAKRVVFSKIFAFLRRKKAPAAPKPGAQTQYSAPTRTQDPLSASAPIQGAQDLSASAGTLAPAQGFLDFNAQEQAARPPVGSLEAYVASKQSEAQIDPSVLEEMSFRRLNLLLKAGRNNAAQDLKDPPNAQDLSAHQDAKDLSTAQDLSPTPSAQDLTSAQDAQDPHAVQDPSAAKDLSVPQDAQDPSPAQDLAGAPRPSKGVVIVKELEENKKILQDLERGEVEKPKDFELPSPAMLAAPKTVKKEINEAEIDEKIEDLLEKLKVFKIEGDIVRTYTGPVVTTFEFKPAPHIKVARVLNLEDDIAMALKAQTIRIQAPIPGKDVIGIEIPNLQIETIYLREIIESELFQKAASPLTIILGKDIVGNPFITDLRKLPHLLIAGTTGSGKSVGINAMILSLLYKNSPERLRLVMVDPKMLEFSIYNDIPHLLTPVITEPKQAITAMANMVVEMDRRYAAMAKTKTKTIENYNEKARAEGFEPMPFIVVIIDELADLMMAGGKEVEVPIARLAQKARACGIHLIVATQRPSTDVITGLIKANFPSRLSYRVGSKIDSKVVLDQMGADSLLGRGDLLFTPPGSSNLVRVHAPWASEAEIDAIAEFLRAQRPVEYEHGFLDGSGETSSGVTGADGEFRGELDELYETAKEIVLSERKTSISYIQRKLGIGYNRSANIIEQLEKTGILSAPNSKGQREVLAG